MKHYCVDYMADPTFYDNDYEYGCRTVDAESAQEAVDILMKDPPRVLGFTVLGVQQVIGTRMRVIDGKVVAK